MLGTPGAELSKEQTVPSGSQAQKIPWLPRWWELRSLQRSVGSGYFSWASVVCRWGEQRGEEEQHPLKMPHLGASPHLLVPAGLILTDSEVALLWVMMAFPALLSMGLPVS